MRLTLATAIAGLAASSALAQTAPPSLTPASLTPPSLTPDDPENIVVTATRTPDLAASIAAGITVIDRATIESRGYTTLVDALSAVPGLRVVQSGGPGSVASVFVRGTNSNQVLVLRDGVPVNDPGDPGSAFNFGDDTLQDVERIEIIRGPMSSLYGSGALGGVINLITRKGSGDLHGDVTLGGGVPRQGLAQGHLAGGSGIWDYAANLEFQSLLGFDQTPQRETTIYTGERDGYRSQLGDIEIGATPVENTRISLLLRGRDAKYGYDSAGLVPFDAGNATGYDASLFGRLGLTSTLLGGAWQTSLYLTRLQDDRRYTITLAPTDPNQSQGDSRYHGRRTDGQWNNTITLPDAGPATANRLTLGYEHINDTADVSLNTISGGFPFDSALHAHADADAGTAGLQTTLYKRLNLTGQLREDATTIGGDAFTWRAGAVFDLSEIATRLKASYGTAFRAPALSDRYGTDSLGYVGNPNLRPEHSAGYEVGFSTDIPVAGRNDAASLSVTYFDNRIRDLITTVFVPIYTSININQARTHGIETALTLNPTTWLAADITYTYTDARDLQTNSLLLRRPFNQGSLNLRITPFPGFTISPEILYVGRFADFLTDNNGLPAGIGLARSGTIANLDISWKTSNHVTLFAWVKNLGGSTFEPANGYQTPGASFLAGVRVAL